MTEDELLEGVCHALALRAQWDDTLAWWHIRRSDLALQMGTPGIPDIMLIIDGRLEAWELKTADGRLSDGQVTWQRLLSAAGVVHRIIRPVDYDQVVNRILADRIVHYRQSGAL